MRIHVLPFNRLLLLLKIEELKMDVPVWNVSLAVKQRHDDSPEGRQTECVSVLCTFGTTAQVYQMKSASTASNYNKKNV